MRIAFIHPRFPSAEGTGATHSATQTVTGLTGNDNDIRVYCPQIPEEASGTTDIELRHLAGNSRHPHTNTRLNKEVLARLEELRDFDVVHSYLTPLLPSIARVGEDPDVKTAMTLNAYGGTCAKNDLLYLNREQCQSKSTRKCLNCIARTGFENDYDFLYWSAGKLFSLRLSNTGESRLEHIDAFRAPSAHVRSNYVQFGYDHDKISVIPHPIDDDFRVPHQSAFTEPYELLYVGALSKHKGVEKLIPILAALNQSETDFQITIVGTGGMEQTLREEAENLGVTDSVDFTGFVPNKELPGVYARHDLFVFPVLWEEPLARVYLESLATGTPIITTEYGSISEIIGDGGVTVDGSVESFVKGIQDIVHEDRFSELASGGKTKSDDYQLDRVVSQIETMYEEI